MLADSKRQAQRCHHQPESLTLIWFQIVFFAIEVAESEFRTQPVATAVSATESVDTTPTCTRADAHFSRAHITVHYSYSTALFQCGHTALAKGKRNLCCALLFDHFHLVCHVFVKRSFCPFPSGHVLTSMLFVSRPSAFSTSFGGSRQEPCASAHWSGMSGCLANPTPNKGLKRISV